MHRPVPAPRLVETAARPARPGYGDGRARRGGVPQRWRARWRCGHRGRRRASPRGAVIARVNRLLPPTGARPYRPAARRPGRAGRRRAPRQRRARRAARRRSVALGRASGAGRRRIGRSRLPGSSIPGAGGASGRLPSRSRPGRRPAPGSHQCPSSRPRKKFTPHRRRLRRRGPVTRTAREVDRPRGVGAAAPFVSAAAGAAVSAIGPLPSPSVARNS